MTFLRLDALGATTILGAAPGRGAPRLVPGALPDLALSVAAPIAPIALTTAFVATATLTFAATGLPPGLTLGADALILGAPTTPGEHAVTVRATDNAGMSAEARFVVRVLAAAPAAFAIGDWTLSDAAAAAGGAATLTVLRLPADNGAALAVIETATGVGAWTPLAPAMPGAFILSGLGDGIAQTVRLRAVNAAGAGAPSDAKIVIPSVGLSGEITLALNADATGVAGALAVPAGAGGWRAAGFAAGDGGGRFALAADGAVSVDLADFAALAGGAAALTRFEARDDAGRRWTIVVTVRGVASSGPAPSLWPAGELAAINATPFDLRAAAWTLIGAGTTRTAHDTDSRFPGAVTVSADANWKQLSTTLTVAMTGAHRASALVRAGTSGRARLLLRVRPTGPELSINGALAIGAAGAVATTPGDEAAVRDVEHVSLDGGLVRIGFTLDLVAGGSVDLRIGPDGTGSVDVFAVALAPIAVREAVAVRATSWIYVADAADSAAGIGVPGDANGAQPSLAAARAAPMAGIKAAVDKATPGCAIVVRGGTEAAPRIYEGSVLFNAAKSGTPAAPIWLVADTYRGATIRGSLTASALEFSTARNIEVHNFQIENRSPSTADNAAVKVVNSVTGGVVPVNDITIAGCRMFGRGRDGVKVAASRGVRLLGCRIDQGGGSVAGVFSESAIDFVTGLRHLVEGCTIRGEWKEGYVPKAGSYGAFRHNDVEITTKAGDNAATIVIGEAGHSRAGQNLPFLAPADEPSPVAWKFAEAQDIEISNNRLKTDFAEAIWLRGATDVTISGNWIDAGTRIARMLRARSSYWNDQARPAPAPHTGFVIYPTPPDGLSPATDVPVYYWNRGHTLTGNWRRTGLAATIEFEANQNNGHTVQSTWTEAATADAVLSGTIGEARWDAAAIRPSLGL